MSTQDEREQANTALLTAVVQYANSTASHAAQGDTRAGAVGWYQSSLIACVDGLKGFPEAIEAIFPMTTVQTGIVHIIRRSLKYVPRREYEKVARDLKPIYTASDADTAAQQLEAFDEKWGQRFPVITQRWLNCWEHVTHNANLRRS